MESSLNALACLKDMKGHSESALSLFRGRLSTNFTYEMVHCLRFLDPTVNQQVAYTQGEREDLVQKVLKYAMALFHRRQEVADDLALLREIGEFISQPGVFWNQC